MGIFCDTSSVPAKLYLYYDGGNPDFHLSVTMQKFVGNADINKDGEVNIQDIQACVNHLLGAQD